MKKRAFFHNLMVLMLALLIPVYLAAHTALKYYEEALQKREIAAAETELMLLSSSTDNMLYMCGGIASQIKNDSQLLHWLGQLKPQQMTYSALYPMFKTWEGYTQPLINCGNADSIYLYLDGLGVVLSTDGVRHLSTMRDTSWQQIYADNKERLLSADFLTCARSLPDGNKTVSCFTPLVNAQGICRGILVINISSRFLDVQTHHSTYANASLFLLNDTNEQFHSSDGRLLENLFDRDSILSLSDGGMAELQSADGEMYLVIAQRSEQFDWRFYQILKETDLFATLSDLRRIFAYILGTAFLVSIGFALFYTIQTYRPVMTMMHIIDSYNETGMVQYPSKKHSDLYDHIIYGLIHTLIEKNTMRIRVAELELAEKEAQLHAIQNRINPHFLYNSLDVVNWMVIRRLGPSNEISHAIKVMADSFRTIFHDNRLLVSLEEEVALLKRYFDFLNVIDYRDLKLTCRIEDEIKMKSVPRLLLQPLIENCYMHSLTKAQTLVIHLIARKKNGCLQVFVVDNGNGIAPGKLTELNEALQSGSKNIRSGASGLCNVNSRLVLRYGERFRLRIFSKEGHGTAIQILIPFDRK